MKKKGFILFLLSIFLILGFITFFGENGIVRFLHLKKELVRIKETNARIEEENRRLREEVRRLQSEKRYIEEIARGELGMVKEGEVVYQFDFPPREKGSSK
jgi:cell division protein FtsB